MGRLENIAYLVFAPKLCVDLSTSPKPWLKKVLPGWVGYMTDGQIEQVFDEIDADKSGTAIQA